MSVLSLVAAPPAADPCQRFQISLDTASWCYSRVSLQRHDVSHLRLSWSEYVTCERSQSSGVQPRRWLLRRRKQSFLEAIDFSEVRSYQDAKLLSDAKFGKLKGGRMSQEQYGCANDSRTLETL